jgi:hypothetical protein
MNGKYWKEDEEIIGMLKAGCAFYHQLCAHCHIDSRLIDRRLQALRKAGHIEFKGRSFGWRAIK